MSKRPILTAILLAAMTASAASAQRLGGIGGGLGGLTGPVGGVLGQVGNTVDRTVGGVTGQQNNPASFVNPSNPVSLDSVSTPVTAHRRRSAAIVRHPQGAPSRPIRANRETLDRDNEGQPVRKGELIVADPDPASLALAHARVSEPCGTSGPRTRASAW